MRVLETVWTLDEKEATDFTEEIDTEMQAEEADESSGNSNLEEEKPYPNDETMHGRGRDRPNGS